MNSKGTNNTVFGIHGGPGFDDSYFAPLKAGSHAFKFRSCRLREMSVDHQLEKVKRELEKIEDNTYLLGHSFGGALALEYLKRYGSSRVTEVILVSPVYDSTWIEDFSERSKDYKKEELQKIRAIAQPNDRLKKQTLIYADLYFPEKSRRVGTKALEKIQYNEAVFTQIYSDYLANFDLIETVRHYAPIITVIHGSQDLILPESYFSHLNNSVKDLRQVRLSQCGHFPFIDCPELFQQTLTSIIEGEL